MISVTRAIKAKHHYQAFPLALLAAAVVSCASSPSGSAGGGTSRLAGKSDGQKSAEVTPSSIQDAAGTPLALPDRERQNRSDLDSVILSHVETGSPDSLRQAVSLVASDPRGMTERNRFVLAIAGELMKFLYPLEQVTWPLPSVPESDRYLGALKASRLGVYDYSAGSSDFLALTLPSAVLFTESTQTDYYTDSENALRRAAAMNPRSVLPTLFSARLAEKRGNSDAALAFYETAWKLDSSCYPAGVGYSRALAARGRGADAYLAAKSLAARYPSDQGMLRLCAETSFAAGDWNTADGYILAVLKNNPDNTAYLLMRARILIERKEFLKANSLLDAFATTNRTDRSYLLLKSRVVREWNKNPVAASALLQEALRLYPGDGEILLSAAAVAYQTGQNVNNQSPRDLVQQVLGSDPDNTQALYLLAEDFLAAKEWKSALQPAQRLVSVNPSPENQIVHVRALLGAGDYAKAKSAASSLYAASPQSPQITGLYLQSLVSLGENAAARAAISSALPDASPALKSVLHYYESRLAGDAESRLASLRSSLLSDPRNQESLFAMYELYMERKDYRKAQYYLKQVVSLDPSNGSLARLLVNLDELLAR